MKLEDIAYPEELKGCIYSWNGLHKLVRKWIPPPDEDYGDFECFIRECVNGDCWYWEDD